MSAPPAPPQYSQHTSFIPLVDGDGDIRIIQTTQPTTYRPNVIATNAPQSQRRQGSIKEPECCSCDRGGGMRQAPAKFLVDASGKTVRVNLLFNTRDCCGPSRGLIDDIPQELFTNGLERDQGNQILPV